VQQVQEVPADGLVVGLDVDLRAVVAPVVPVAEHGAERGDQPVGDVAGAGDVVVVLLGERASQRGHAAAHDVHRVAAGGQRHQHLAHRERQAPQRPELALVAFELRAVRQPAVDQEVCDLLELAVRGEFEDVVTPVVQVVAGATDRAQRRVAGRNAGEGDGLLGLAGIGSGCVGHGNHSLSRAKSSSSFFS
jgi:hypothetical protein